MPHILIIMQVCENICKRTECALPSQKLMLVPIWCGCRNRVDCMGTNGTGLGLREQRGRKENKREKTWMMNYLTRGGEKDKNERQKGAIRVAKQKRHRVGETR